MKQQITKLNKEKADLTAESQSLIELQTDRELTAEEQEQFDSLMAKIDSLNKRIDNCNRQAQASLTAPSVPDINAPTPQQLRELGEKSGEPVISFPSRRGPLICFSGENGDRQAFRFGMFVGAIAGNGYCANYCREHGIPLRWENPAGAVSIGAVYNEGSNTAGGYLVLPEFDRDIIKLVERYGVFRRNARISPMGAETKSRPRRTGGLTAHFVGESKAGTESTGSWDNVNLVAKKAMVLTRISNEFNADTIINTADNIADEAARAFAKLEDQCGFIGDGTSAYGGIKGVCTRLSDINGVDDGGGLVLGAGDTFAEITLANLNSVVAILPEFADPDEDNMDAAAAVKWYCSKMVWASVMQRLETAAGGNTVENLKSGARRRVSLGYPVQTTAIMPKTDDTSQIIALFGDLRLAADLGDRAQMMIAMSPDASVGGESVFERDQLAMRFTERFDINVHDVGTASAAGPVVGLISAAS